jgi:hypothetical protein
MKSWKFGALVLSMVAIAACSSEGTTGTTSGNAGGSGGTGSGGNGGATTGTMTSTGTAMTTATGTSTTATGTSTGTGGGTCADATDCSLCKAQDMTCATCCAKANPAAYAKFTGYVISDCACAAAAPCFTQCGGVGNTMPTVCTDPSTGKQECVACLNGLGMNACVMKASQTCGTDAACLPLGMCQQSCGTAMP